MLSWTCEKCGTNHETPEQRQKCARDERRGNIIMALIIITILVGIIGIEVLWNQYVYGDWKCAFAHCRKVVP
jgi:hypothetical protein